MHGNFICGRDRGLGLYKKDVVEIYETSVLDIEHYIYAGLKVFPQWVRVALIDGRLRKINFRESIVVGTVFDFLMINGEKEYVASPGEIICLMEDRSIYPASCISETPEMLNIDRKVPEWL